jgi:hypothetical protein
LGAAWVGHDPPELEGGVPPASAGTKDILLFSFSPEEHDTRNNNSADDDEEAEHRHDCNT